MNAKARILGVLILSYSLVFVAAEESEIEWIKGLLDRGLEMHAAGDPNAGRWLSGCVRLSQYLGDEEKAYYFPKIKSIVLSDPARNDPTVCLETYRWFGHEVDALERLRLLFVATREHKDDSLNLHLAIRYARDWGRDMESEALIKVYFDSADLTAGVDGKLIGNKETDLAIFRSILNTEDWATVDGDTLRSIQSVTLRSIIGFEVSLEQRMACEVQHHTD